ncbi:PIH1 domain-containing protein 1 [Protobothrops mucrosquamatus]|uniref:PIH1 domain-containing protein 1 n=1 Tax=Protobothrops mucrosquamatus TaxID=103944 RepID=UPI000775C774|nr:PIH1 domain-containing protein 1 [Protobothrops mucrosquamatus]
MTSVTDKSLLSAELQEDEEEEFNRLLLQAAQNIQGSVPSPAESKPIRPLPGFCLKTHTSSGEKIFVNVCRSPHIPSPPDLTNEELACLIESENASTFRIPMSLGEPHAEVDKSGNGCTAYDVTINTNFFNKMESNQFLKELFLTIAMEGLSEKYKMDINNQDWRILKNRKFMGSILEQNIRTKSKPIIQEMHSSSAAAPEFTIVAEPSTSHPDRLVAKISLPEMISVRNLELDLGEDRIVLRGHPELYHLDIFIPYSIVPEETQAQFHKETKILTVLMPVQRPLLLLP